MDRDGDVMMDPNLDSVGDFPHNPSVTVDIQPDSSNEPVLGHFKSKYHFKECPGAAQKYGRGCTFMDTFDWDEHAAMWENNLYYPWASCAEQEITSFLLCSSLSMAVIDKFLLLELVSLPL